MSARPSLPPQNYHERVTKEIRLVPLPSGKVTSRRIKAIDVYLRIHHNRPSHTLQSTMVKSNKQSPQTPERQLQHAHHPFPPIGPLVTPGRSLLKQLRAACRRSSRLVAWHLIPLGSPQEIIPFRCPYCLIPSWLNSLHVPSRSTNLGLLPLVPNRSITSEDRLPRNALHGTRRLRNRNTPTQIRPGPHIACPIATTRPLSLASAPNRWPQTVLSLEVRAWMSPKCETGNEMDLFILRVISVGWTPLKPLDTTAGRPTPNAQSRTY